MMTLAASAGAIAIAPMIFALCPPLPDESAVEWTDLASPDSKREAYGVETEHTWAIVNASARMNDDDEGGPAGGADPAVAGAWDWARLWDVTAIHAALLPDGRVLQYSYPSGGSDGSRARLWDPQTRSFTNVDWGTNHFCSGLSHLPDGRLFVTGGTDDGCEFQGRFETNAFDPVARTWTRLADMYDGRWYPVNTLLPDGRVLVFSGLGLDCESNAEVELYDESIGFEVLGNGHRYLSLYPLMHLLSDGRIAHVGPEQPTYTFDLEAGWRFITNSRWGWRSSGTSVLLPGRTDEIMIIGGAASEKVVTNTCEIIDFSDPSPRYEYTSSMHHGRAHADVTILPDKTVLVTGGGRIGLYGDPVNVPEIYDPATQTWTEAAPHRYGRMYHATTVLLPDGRVLVAGQDSGPSANIGEMYRPPYFFKGPRPSIASAPPIAAYGRWVDIETPEAADIDSIVLIKLTAVTHSVNTEQRLVDLPFSVVDEGRVRARMPQRATEAPPGYYMLFVVNGARVPSGAEMVRVEPWTVGDVDGDGVVDFADIVRVLSAWGPCQAEDACPEDIDRDGVVGLGDLLMVLAGWG